MEKILTQFGIQPILLAAQVVNFLILLFLLKKFVYKPVLKVLEQRKERIAQSLKEADEIEQKLAKITEEEEKRLVIASSEGEKIIKQAQDMSNQIIEEGKVKAQELAEQIIVDAKAQLDIEREKLRQEIRAHLADLVVTSLEKVTGRVLSKNDQKEMVKKTVRSLNEN